MARDKVKFGTNTAVIMHMRDKDFGFDDSGNNGVLIIKEVSFPQLFKWPNQELRLDSSTSRAKSFKIPKDAKKGTYIFKATREGLSSDIEFSISIDDDPVVGGG